MVVVVALVARELLDADPDRPSSLSLVGTEVQAAVLVLVAAVLLSLSSACNRFELELGFKDEELEV